MTRTFSATGSGSTPISTAPIASSIRAYNTGHPRAAIPAKRWCGRWTLRNQSTCGRQMIVGRARSGAAGGFPAERKKRSASTRPDAAPPALRSLSKRALVRYVRCRDAAERSASRGWRNRYIQRLNSNPRRRPLRRSCLSPDFQVSAPISRQSYRMTCWRRRRIKRVQAVDWRHRATCEPADPSCDLEPPFAWRDDPYFSDDGRHGGAPARFRRGLLLLHRSQSRDRD